MKKIPKIKKLEQNFGKDKKLKTNVIERTKKRKRKKFDGAAAVPC